MQRPRGGGKVCFQYSGMQAFAALVVFILTFEGHWCHVEEECCGVTSEPNICYLKYDLLNCIPKSVKDGAIPENM